MADSYRIRPATEADLGQVHAIERRVFRNPWALGGFRAFLSDLSLVMESNGDVVGYVVARYAADMGEILNIAVHPDHLRRGLARRLVTESLERLSEKGVATVFLEVRESNAAARALYEEFGFEQVGRRNGYYRNPTEDALVLALTLTA